MMRYHFEMSPKTKSFKHKLGQKLIITIFSLRNHLMIYVILSTEHFLYQTILFHSTENTVQPKNHGMLNHSCRNEKHRENNLSIIGDYFEQCSIAW